MQTLEILEAKNIVFVVKKTKNGKMRIIPNGGIFISNLVSIAMNQLKNEIER